MISTKLYQFMSVVFSFCAARNKSTNIVNWHSSRRH